MRIGFVTCSDLSRYFDSKKEPLLTHDDLVAAEYLREKGHEVNAVVWTDGARNLTDFDKVVIRSPWDYMDSPEKRQNFIKFIGDCEALGVNLYNDVALIKWNLDKIYLSDLNKRGVPIVPSCFYGSDNPLTKEVIKRRLATGKVQVLKPRVSAAAKDTFLVDQNSNLDELVSGNGMVRGDFDAFVKDRGFIVQEFVSSICSKGEWSLVYFSGAYSHCVLKKPKKDGWLVQDELGGSVESVEASKDFIDFGSNVIKQITAYSNEVFGKGPPPLYARVDLVLLDDMSMALGEVELIEPELFFISRYQDGNKPNIKALDRFYNSLMS